MGLTVCPPNTDDSVGHSVLLCSSRLKSAAFPLRSCCCLVWAEWFRSEINPCFPLLFLALSSQTRPSFSWPGPSVFPLCGLLLLYVFSSARVSDPFSSVFFSPLVSPF